MPIKNDVILVSHYGMTSRSYTSSQTAREAIAHYTLPDEEEKPEGSQIFVF